MGEVFGVGLGSVVIKLDQLELMKWVKKKSMGMCDV